MAETLRQAKAFDIYYSMGSGRSLEAVSKEIGVSKNSVFNWSKKFNWKERIAERDKANAQKMFEDTDESIVDSLVGYRKIIKVSIENYVKLLKGGSIKINTPAEFIKLAELDLKIAEVLESKDTANNTHAVSSETLETLKTIEKELSSIVEPEDEDGEEDA